MMSQIKNISAAQSPQILKFMVLQSYGRTRLLHTVREATT